MYAGANMPPQNVNAGRMQPQVNSGVSTMSTSAHSGININPHPVGGASGAGAANR
jgi:hypothetical protein